jgi:trans-aconitate methyltransferase
MPQTGKASAAAPGAEYYDKIYEASPAYRLPWEQSWYAGLWRKVVEALRDAEVSSVIELGCGTGQFAACLAEHLPDLGYMGVDFSPSAIRYAQAQNPKAQFSVGDVRDMLWLGATDPAHPEATAVVLTEVLEHVDDDRELLEKIVPGLWVVFSVPNFDDPGHVRFFESEEDVRQWYGPSLDNLTLSWQAGRAQPYGYWLGVGRR